MLTVNNMSIFGPNISTTLDFGEIYIYICRESIEDDSSSCQNIFTGKIISHFFKEKERYILLLYQKGYI